MTPDTGVKSLYQHVHAMKRARRDHQRVQHASVFVNALKAESLQAGQAEVRSSVVA